jgi:hypothetical protein|uniref:Uncharacterized protein n=1 Tax=Picea glauca TaxID=3330 RepID=A0A101LVA9_PICGL|nr:hypothetical protein ABT39_MTgene2127 [Picea glauca]QHR86907.1 hypothetical protein Q903MT_gene914 [Picea sitchensis]
MLLVVLELNIDLYKMELRVMLKGRQLNQWVLVPLLPQLSLSNGSY